MSDHSTSPQTAENQQESALLWQPSQAQINATEMVAFQNFVNKQYGIQLNTYQALHEWSVTQRHAFWQTLWEYFNVLGDHNNTPGDQILESGPHLKEDKWFPHTRLNFAENLLKTALTNPAQCALIQYREDGTRDELSYGQLYNKVAKAASMLCELGVNSGDRVAAIVPNGIAPLVGMLASASLGAVWSSCSPDFGEQGIVDRFSQIEPKLLIACNGYQYAGKLIDCRAKARGVRNTITSIESLLCFDFTPDNTWDKSTLEERESLAFNQILHEPEASTVSQTIAFKRQAFASPLYILFSSGTTGKPKCIVHGAGGTLLQHIKELALHSNVKNNDKIFYYTTCGWMMWNWLASSLALGATLVLYDGSPFHPEQSVLFDIAEQESIKIFGASAKYYSACEKFGLAPIKSHQLSNLNTLLSTGSPLSQESFDYLYTAVKADVCVSSISGGTDIVSCFALGNPTLPVYRGELQCAGLGMDLAFFDDHGNTLPKGKGELVCRKSFPSMPVHFWNDPTGANYHAAYFERFDNVWAHGDYGEFKAHGAGNGTGNGTEAGASDTPEQYGVLIHGRSDAVLNPGGVRIGTAEIYRQVEKVDEVFESIAIGQRWQDDVRIILFVRLQPDAHLDDALTAKIKASIRDNATPRHVPAKIIQVEDIPRTRSGKIVELAVNKVVHGEAVNNTEALSNPEALSLYKNLPELSS